MQFLSLILVTSVSNKKGLFITLLLLEKEVAHSDLIFVIRAAENFDNKSLQRFPKVLLCLPIS